MDEQSVTPEPQDLAIPQALSRHCALRDQLPSLADLGTSGSHCGRKRAMRAVLAMRAVKIKKSPVPDVRGTLRGTCIGRSQRGLRFAGG